MTKNTKILIGVALLILGAVVIYFITNKKASTTTSTTTSTGLHGMDLGGIWSSLLGTGTKAPETESETETPRETAPRAGARNTIDVVSTM